MTKLEYLEIIAADALNELAEKIAKDAQAHCPKDTGALRESMRIFSNTFVEVGKGSADGSISFKPMKNTHEIEIIYQTPYAAYVHEMPATTRWTTPGTHEKWLELAVRNAINNQENEGGSK